MTTKIIWSFTRWIQTRGLTTKNQRMEHVGPAPSALLRMSNKHPELDYSKIVTRLLKMEGQVAHQSPKGVRRKI